MDTAFIFDLNGTMIDDMQFHVTAWHHVINNQLGGNLDRETVKGHMYGKNSEVLARIFGENHFTEEQANQISVDKEKQYQREYRQYLQLIPGLDRFLEEAYQLDIPMAIGSAAIMFNIDFVLDNLNIRHYFKAIVSADDVIKSKPDPETYLKAASQLGVPAANCLVFEDAPKGVESALNAGMKCVVLTLLHQPHEFEYLSNIDRYITDYTQLSPRDLLPKK